MKGMFSLLSLVGVLAIVALAARHPWQANLGPVGGAASASASTSPSAPALIVAPAASQPAVQQLQHELAQALDQGARHTHDAEAGDADKH